MSFLKIKQLKLLLIFFKSIIFELLIFEQGADDNRVEEYVRRWGIWVKSGVDGLLVGLALLGFVPQPYLQERRSH